MIKISLSLVFLLLLLVPVSALSSANTTSYSLVHLSDTQNLATRFPKTYDYTFSYLESVKTRYNISAIIITGDLVNTWDSKKEWDAYSHAVNKTTIPVYVIAGNHDTNNGKNYRYFTGITGNPMESYVTRVENFDLVGINYLDTSLKSQDFAALRKSLLLSPENFTIIATHNYMDKNGILSPLGRDIDHQLIVKPTLIMAGHVRAAFVRDRMIGGYPVIEDLTNYQNGIPLGDSSKNISAGTFYTVSTRDGMVEKISSRTIWITPRQFLDREQVVYDISAPEHGAGSLQSDLIADDNSTQRGMGAPLVTVTDSVQNSVRELLNELFWFY
ncbi:MAG: metallophosphoesterase [Methanoregula sp.]|nr:metallophosphoesterase [Methanoregula sp.]